MEFEKRELGALIPVEFGPCLTGKTIPAPKELVRPSLLHLDNGKRVLEGILFQGQGAALVFYQRISEVVYDMTIESFDGQVLLAVRLQQQHDPKDGHGMFTVIGNAPGFSPLWPAAAASDGWIVLWTAFCHWGIEQGV